MVLLILLGTAMNAKGQAVLLTVMILSIGTVGTVAAAPGEGPPSDMPNPVPDFVSDLLDAISEFIGSVLNGVTEQVGGLVPAVVEPGIDDGV